MSLIYLKFTLILIKSLHITHEEQRAYIKIECLKQTTPTQILANLREACGDSALSRTQVFECAKRFSSGMTSISNDPRPIRPLSSTNEDHVQRVAELRAEDPRITCYSIAQSLEISSSIAFKIVTKILGKRKLVAKFVPHALTEKQKHNRIVMCKSHLSRFKHYGQAFLKRIVAVDETWARCYEPELKRHFAEWCGKEDKRPVKMRQSGSKLKQMIIFAYSSEKVVLVNAVPPGSSVYQEYYKGFLTRLRQAIREKQPQLADASPIRLQDNASCHTAEIVTGVLDRFGSETRAHTLFSGPEPLRFRCISQNQGTSTWGQVSVARRADDRLDELCQSERNVWITLTGILKLPDR